MRRFASVLTLVVLVAPVACSSDDDETLSSSTVNALASAFCNKTSQCLSETAMRVIYGSLQNCGARQAAQIQLDSKGAGYDVTEASARACLEKINAATCEAIATDNLPECAFRGTLADGAACTADAQCASGSCFVADGGSCGRCAPPVGENADCSQASCDGGLQCNFSKRCVRPVAAGASCNEAAQCSTGLNCVAGTCVAALQAGATCVFGQDENRCDVTKGLTCAAGGSATEGTCTALDLARVGEPCGIVGNRSVLCEGGECVFGPTEDESAPSPGTCQAYLADGAACDERSLPCQSPAECRGGRCTLLDASTCK